jgi:tRNA U34 5-carboxymethylaminomethyl modifying GTPase MnmE/TrmE
MKPDEIKKLTLVEAREKLMSLYESPYIDVYIATKVQLIKLAKQIEGASIDFSSDDSKFDSFIKWGDKFEKISDSLDSIMNKMDKEALKKAEEKVRSSKTGSVESFAGRRS